MKALSIVLGGGISGVSAALAELRRGRKVLVLDEKLIHQKRRCQLNQANIPYLENLGDDLQLELRLNDSGIANFSPDTKVVTSPGLDKNHWMKEFFTSRGVQVVSEIDNALSELGRALVGVTGTNGKTTTVNLVHNLLDSSGIRSSLCGNMGFAPSELCARGKLEESGLVIELSSYQLETSELAVPEIAVILNLAPDHLERHKTIEGYLAAKARIVSAGGLRAEYSVVPAGSPQFAGEEFSGKCGRAVFGTVDEVIASRERYYCGFTEDAKTLRCSFPENIGEKASVAVTAEIDISGFKLFGRHNLQNLSAAVLAALLAGADPVLLEDAVPALQTVAHRLEQVGEFGGVSFINDSKATNLDALFAGVSAIKTRYPAEKVTILVGGRAKKEDWKLFADDVAGQLNCSVVFGESADMIESHLRRVPGARYLRAGDLEQAVHQALEHTPAGGVILLSPGCASFDAYESFEERGSHLRQIFVSISRREQEKVSADSTPGALLSAC